MSYTIAASAARFEHTIRKSRFIGAAVPVRTPDDATAALDGFRREFPDATHRCWAYVLGDPQHSTAMRMDDDGEPSGTAGKPILNVLLHKKIGDLLVVVVRYFGGVKLGAGGLVRAYASTATGVMELVETSTFTPVRRARLAIRYGDEGALRRMLEERELTIDGVDYGEAVELVVAVPVDRWDAFARELADTTGGTARIAPA